MKKILIILGSYFPKPSPNGICVKQVASELKNREIEVTILATKSRGLTDSEIIDSVIVHRIKPRLFQRMVEWCDSNRNVKLSHIFRKIALIINKINNILFFPLWPLVSPLYTYRYYKKAKELHEKNKYDGILCVYTPIDALIAGSLMKKKYKDITLMFYFLDTLSGGVAPKLFSRRWLEKRGYKWDNKLVNIADSIFVMESHRAHYGKPLYNKFRDKIKIIDIPLMREIIYHPNKSEISLSKEKINLVYTGSLLKHIKNPTYMLKVFSYINRTSDIELHIFGSGDCNDLLDEYSEGEKGIPLFVHGQVEHIIANNAMMESDILINIGSLVDSQIPSKIFEYVATGKPIISFYKNDTEPSIPYLTQYPLSLLIKEDWDRIEDNAKLIIDFVHKAKGKSIDYSDIKDMYRNNTPEPLVNYILRMIEA